MEYIKDIREIKEQKVFIERKKAFNSRVKWTEYFQDEQELLNTLKMIDKEIKFEDHIDGYEYINSFARQIRCGKILTEKQVRQCKRLASQIKLAYLKCCCCRLGYNNLWLI